MPQKCLSASACAEAAAAKTPDVGERARKRRDAEGDGDEIENCGNRVAQGQQQEPDGGQRRHPGHDRALRTLAGEVAARGRRHVVCLGHSSGLNAFGRARIAYPRQLSPPRVDRL